MTPTSNPTGMRVLDLSAPVRRAPRIAVEAGPFHELLVVLTGLGHEEEWETYTIGRAWFDQVRTAAEAEVQPLLAALALQGCGVWAPLAGLAHRLGATGDVDATIDGLAGLPAADFYTALVDGAMAGWAQREHPRLLEAAAQGDPAARRRLAATLGEERAACEDADHDARSARGLAALEPPWLQDTTVALLRAMRRAIAGHLEDVVPALERDAALVVERTSGLAIEDAVEAGTNGIHYTPEPGVRTILLIPQVAMRPWVVIGQQGDLKIFFHAAAEESLEAGRDAPPPRLLALTKALAEEQRLRMLRRLAAGPASLQQLADQLGIAKSTAHHHTVVLRSAGLITVDISGDNREMSLRDAALRDVAGLLDDYLWRGRR